MTKVQNRLNRLLTVVMVISVLICVVVCVQVVRGKEASLFGYRIFDILTGSMEPTIPTGTGVLVHKVDPNSLEEGDIITFLSRDAAIYGAYNTHRIVGVEKDGEGRLCYRTKGDANNIEDALRVYPEDIQGKVVFHMTGDIASFMGYLHTKLGFFTVILLPIMAATALFTRDFKRQVKEYINESAAQAVTAENTTPSAAEKVTDDKTTDMASQVSMEEEQPE